jgi:hypothetical protein
LNQYDGWPDAEDQLIAPVDEVSEQRASRALDSGRKKGRHTVIEYDGQITAGVTQHKEYVGKDAIYMSTNNFRH